MAGVAAGTVTGSGWLTGGHTAIALSALGAALAVYAILGLLRVRFQVRAHLFFMNNGTIKGKSILPEAG